MRVLVNPLVKLFVTIAVFVAMAGTGFAHRGVATQPDQSMIAYVAAGGSLDDLCGEVGFGSESSCDACRLVDTATGPINATAGAARTYRRDGQRLTLPAALPLILVTNPSCPVRAPPVV